MTKTLLRTFCGIFLLLAALCPVSESIADDLKPKKVATDILDVDPPLPLIHKNNFEEAFKKADGKPIVVYYCKENDLACPRMMRSFLQLKREFGETMDFYYADLTEPGTVTFMKMANFCNCQFIPAYCVLTRNAEGKYTSVLSKTDFIDVINGPEQFNALRKELSKIAEQKPPVSDNAVKGKPRRKDLERGKNSFEEGKRRFQLFQSGKKRHDLFNAYVAVGLAVEDGVTEAARERELVAKEMTATELKNANFLVAGLAEIDILDSDEPLEEFAPETKEDVFKKSSGKPIVIFYCKTNDKTCPKGTRSFLRLRREFGDKMVFGFADVSEGATLPMMKDLANLNIVPSYCILLATQTEHYKSVYSRNGVIPDPVKESYQTEEEYKNWLKLVQDFEELRSKLQAAIAGQLNREASRKQIPISMRARSSR